MGCRFSMPSSTPLERRPSPLTPGSCPLSQILLSDALKTYSDNLEGIPFDGRSRHTYCRLEEPDPEQIRRAWLHDGLAIAVQPRTCPGLRPHGPCRSESRGQLRSAGSRGVRHAERQRVHRRALGSTSRPWQAPTPSACLVPPHWGTPGRCACWQSCTVSLTELGGASKEGSGIGVWQEHMERNPPPCEAAACDWDGPGHFRARLEGASLRPRHRACENWLGK